MNDKREFTVTERVAYYRARAELLLSILYDMRAIKESSPGHEALFEKLQNTLNFTASRIEALEKQLWITSKAARKEEVR